MIVSSCWTGHRQELVLNDPWMERKQKSTVIELAILLRSEHTRRQVAATCRGDTLQRQIASCALEKIRENLCRRNKILATQQVAQIQSDLIFCNLLQRQNFVAETKIFTNILQYTRSDLSLRRVASLCCCN